MSSKSVDEKRVLRQNRFDLISSLSPQRVWLFVKQLRDLSRRNAATMTYKPGKSAEFVGMEDIFAEGTSFGQAESLHRTHLIFS